MEMNADPRNSNTRQSVPGIEQDKRILEGRRSFFLWLIAVGAAAMGALLAVPLVRYVLYPVFATTTSRSWSHLGDFSDYASITTPDRKDAVTKQVDGWRESVAKKPVYVVKGKRKPSINDKEVLTAVCPHLGCDVPWDAAQNKFHCPCHGSEFAEDGSLLRGPAKRGMDTLPIKVENGKLKTLYEYFQALLPYKKITGY